MQGGFELGNFNGEAVVNDARAAGSNPAGLALLDRSEIFVGASVSSVSLEFESDGNTNIGGGNGGDAGDTGVGAGFSYAHKINPDLSLGLHFGVPFGGEVEYDDSWAGRFIVQNAEYYVYALTASAGYRMNDWLSLGAGVSAQYAELEQDIALGFPGSSVEGKAKLEKDDSDLGFTLGALLMPTNATKIGIAYRSEVDFELGGTLDLTIPAGQLSRTAEITTEMPTPQRVLVSVFQALSQDTGVTLDLGWTDFSSFDVTQINLNSGQSVQLPRNWDDTWRMGLQVQHKFAPKWAGMAGITYDSSPVDDEDRTPDLPYDRQISANLGVSYDWSENMILGCQYSYMDLGDGKIDYTGPLGGRLSGEYDSNNVHALGFVMRYKF